MTKRDFQLRDYAKERSEEFSETDWPEPPQNNLFEDTSISALYLEKIAIAMFHQNIRGASYVEDIAYQLDTLGTDYIRVIKQRDKAFDLLRDAMYKNNLTTEKIIKVINGLEK